MGANIKVCLQRNFGVFRLSLKDGLPAKSQILVVIDDFEKESEMLKNILRAHVLNESFKPVGSTASLRLEVGGFEAPVEVQELSITKIPEDSLECAACGISATDVQNLRIHYREHIADGTLSCSHCEILFKTLASFKEHLQLHNLNEKKQVEKFFAYCDQCEMKFSSVKGLASHRRKHVLERKLGENQNCRSAFVQKTEGPATVRQLLEERKLTMEQNKSNMIICAQCNDVFTAKNKFDAHVLKTHPETLNDRCPQCEKVFLTSDELKEHILERHSVHFSYQGGKIPSQLTEFGCNYCPLSFQQPLDLLSHCKLEHAQRLKSFECPNCGKKFSMEKRYLNHVLSKSNECGKKPTCTNCSKLFSSQKSLRDHMRAVHSENQSLTSLIRCSVCNEGYATKSALRYHVKAKHGIERHPCSVCNKVFALRVQKIRHERRVHQGGDKHFACNLCKRSFFTSRELLQHLLNGHKVIPDVNEHGQAILPDGSVGPTMKYYACEYCPMTTYSRKSFIRHRVDHTGIWPFTCEVCGKGFSERFQALKHVRHQHALSSDTTLNCSQCPRVFVDDASFATHLDTHKNSTGQVCDLCNKLYENYHALENHKTIAHNLSGEERFRCNLCNRNFTSEALLRQHKLSEHFQRKLFTCSLCSRVFRRQMDLRSHFYTKCRLRHPPTSCNLCHTSLRNSNLFKIHKKLHQGLKPFSCLICSQSFTFSSSLSKHVKRHHPVSRQQKARKRRKTPVFGQGFTLAACVKSPIATAESDELLASSSSVLLDLAELADVIEVDN